MNKKIICIKVVLLIFLLSLFSCDEHKMNKDLGGDWTVTHFTHKDELIIDNSLGISPFEVTLNNTVPLLVDLNNKELLINLKRNQTTQMNFEYSYENDTPYVRIKNSKDNRFNGLYTVSFSKTIDFFEEDKSMNLINYILRLDSKDTYIFAIKSKVVKKVKQ